MDLGILSASVTALRSFLAHSEDAFLRTGEQLGALSTRAEGLVDTQGLLADATGPVVRLAEEIQRMDACLGQMRSRSVDRHLRLEGLRAHIETVSRHRARFESAIQALPVLGLYARIENSRTGMGSVGLESVASDVLRLSARITPIFDELFLEAQGLRDGSSTLIGRIVELTTDPAGRDSGLADAGAGFAHLQEVCLGMEAVTAFAAEATSRIVQDVVSVLVGLQAHDVTRQRIEHVVEALSELVARLPAESRMDADLATGMASSLAVQVRQLRGAREHLVAALHEIRASLVEVSSIIVDLGARTDRVVGHGQASPIAQVEEGVGQTITTLRAFLATHRLAEDELDRIARATTAMGAHVDTIEDISQDVNLVAVNALIITQQLGEAGRTFSVVASEIQAVARSLTDETGQVTVALRAMASAAAEIQAMEPGGIVDQLAEGEAVAAAMGGVVSEVRAFHAALEQRLRRLGEGGARLGREVAAITRQLDAETEKAEHLAEVERALTELERQALVEAGDRPGAASAHLPLSQAYTMEAERDIHRAAAGVAAPPKVPEPAPAGSSARPDLAPNVELF